MSVTVDFWFEFASTYSYLSIMRIEEEAQARAVKLRWRPFLLGPIFASQGLNTSPFRIYPVKGRYMWRDMERRAARYGLAFRCPLEDRQNLFPQNGLWAARMALVGLKQHWGIAFCQSVYQAQFVAGRDIADKNLLISLAVEAGAATDILEQAGSPEIKQQLRTNTEEAQASGLFGAPSFTVAGELFWGDDRLEEALDWAVRYQD